MQHTFFALQYGESVEYCIARRENEFGYSFPSFSESSNFIEFVPAESNLHNSRELMSVRSGIVT